MLILGKVSIANHHLWIEAQSPEHEELAVLAMQNMVRDLLMKVIPQNT